VFFLDHFDFGNLESEILIDRSYGLVELSIDLLIEDLIYELIRRQR
jgi:hypothetical protein